MALVTGRDGMHADVLRMRHGFQGLSRVTRLPAGRLAARPPQTTRVRLGESIAGRRLAAIAAVLDQLILQHLDAGFQLSDHLDELVDQGDHRFFALLVDRMNLFVGAQRNWCHRR
jgi:hypothetical protein